MHLFVGTFLLFALNIVDALLTIVWVRNGVATEGNRLMAEILSTGEATFLMAKLAVGTIAAVVLLRWRHLPVAKYGLAIALASYISLMGIHLFTGLWAYGMISDASLNHLLSLPSELLSLFI